MLPIAVERKETKKQRLYLLFISFLEYHKVVKFVPIKIDIKVNPVFKKVFKKERIR